MNDTARILEAFDVLTQQMTNLQTEMTGLRADVRSMALSEDAAKKKWMPSSENCTTPWSSWHDSVRGERSRIGGRHW
jgi:Tfp pilus assembly protein PilO